MFFICVPLSTKIIKECELESFKNSFDSPEKLFKFSILWNFYLSIFFITIQFIFSYISHFEYILKSSDKLIQQIIENYNINILYIINLTASTGPICFRNQETIKSFKKDSINLNIFKGLRKFNEIIDTNIQLSYALIDEYLKMNIFFKNYTIIDNSQLFNSSILIPALQPFYYRQDIQDISSFSKTYNSNIFIAGEIYELYLPLFQDSTPSYADYSSSSLFSSSLSININEIKTSKSLQLILEDSNNIQYAKSDQNKEYILDYSIINLMTNHNIAHLTTPDFPQDSTDLRNLLFISFITIPTREVSLSYNKIYSNSYLNSPPPHFINKYFNLHPLIGLLIHPNFEDNSFLILKLIYQLIIDSNSINDIKFLIGNESFLYGIINFFRLLPYSFHKKRNYFTYLFFLLLFKDLLMKYKSSFLLLLLNIKPTIYENKDCITVSLDKIFPSQTSDSPDSTESSNSTSSDISENSNTSKFLSKENINGKNLNTISNIDQDDFYSINNSIAFLNSISLDEFVQLEFVDTLIQIWSFCLNELEKIKLNNIDKLHITKFSCFNYFSSLNHLMSSFTFENKDINKKSWENYEELFNITLTLTILIDLILINLPNNILSNLNPKKKIFIFFLKNVYNFPSIFMEKLNEFHLNGIDKFVNFNIK